MNFQPFCCKCLRAIDHHQGGSLVFSCGDYLCSSCSDVQVPKDCPGCGKQNVKSLSLSENLPHEVAQSMADISKQIQDLHQTITFQIKYYKQTIAMLSTQACSNRNSQTMNQGSVNSNRGSDRSMMQMQPSSIPAGNAYANSRNTSTNDTNGNNSHANPSSRPQSTSSIVSKHFPVPVSFEKQYPVSNRNNNNNNNMIAAVKSPFEESNLYSQSSNGTDASQSYSNNNSNNSNNSNNMGTSNEYRPSSSASNSSYMSQGSKTGGGGGAIAGDFSNSQASRGSNSNNNNNNNNNYSHSSNMNSSELFRSPSSRLATPIPRNMQQSVSSPSRIRSPHMNIVRGNNNNNFGCLSSSARSMSSQNNSDTNTK